MHMEAARGSLTPVLARMGGVPGPITTTSFVGRALTQRGTIFEDPRETAGVSALSTDLTAEFSIVSLIAVPLLRNDVALGVLYFHRTLGGPFSTQQVTLIETFADQAVIAIENARSSTNCRRATRR